MLTVHTDSYRAKRVMKCVYVIRYNYDLECVAISVISVSNVINVPGDGAVSAVPGLGSGCHDGEREDPAVSPPLSLHHGEHGQTAERLSGAV